MSDDRAAASTGDEQRGNAPPLSAGAREAEMPSAIAERPLRRWTLAASLGLHAGVLLALSLIHISEPTRP